MSSQHVLNHDDNVYLAVTVSPSSRFMANPEQLAVHPSLTHLGMVGEILSSLNGLDGVKHVDVQGPPRMRAKRGDEL
ncbi:uncharacterized protein C8Q71DRAFT_853008 [Rhodofomes roseus]|uniref:Uncharacterized protein n=1 Tax=Rhodofomes roseus TaxID=34475 RepID=A0ABQ8KTT2_9APHY|nr:uncharacterized protein C8Q71DRAFT_853008 [Rhodofomes roseus]KAH9842451.1 hypothetical protein C8Q71DRAFT_853008 [Rhodofomes roseus]